MFVHMVVYCRHPFWILGLSRNQCTHCPGCKSNMTQDARGDFEIAFESILQSLLANQKPWDKVNWFRSFQYGRQWRYMRYSSQNRTTTFNLVQICDLGPLRFPSVIYRWCKILTLFCIVSYRIVTSVSWYVSYRGLAYRCTPISHYVCYFPQIVLNV
jgi:hypothetical protein